MTKLSQIPFSGGYEARSYEGVVVKGWRRVRLKMISDEPLSCCGCL